MPRKIVLHAGFHKTGTSTIQQCLRANRKALMPALAIRLKGQMQDLMHATRGYSTWRDPLTLAKVARRFDALLADLPEMSKRTLVLSGEELSGHMPGRGSLADYSAAVDLAQLYSDVIKARFPGVPVAFLYSTRSAASWLESAYWEHVKSASMTLGFDEFADAYGHGANLPAIAAQVNAAVGHPVQTATFEDGGDPVTALLDLCDVPTPLRSHLSQVAASNTRLPRDVLLELLAANRAYPDRAQRKAAKQDILTRMQTS
ncbi:MAG: hypothetical protein AAF214_10685 [Pseudomonadota bacterium]